MGFNVYSRMKATKIIPVSVNADGTLALANNDVTVTKDSTGVYSVTLAKSTQQLLFPFVTCGADGAARHIAQCPKADITAKACKVKTYSYADALADAPFDLFLVVSNGRSPQFGVVPSAVYAGLLAPRLLMFHYAGATDALNLGNNEGSFSKVGTGIYDLTLKRGFARNFYVMAVTNSLTRAVEFKSKTLRTVRFETVATAGGAAADAEIFVLILGSNTHLVGRNVHHQLLCPFPFLFMQPFEYDGSGDSMVRGSAYVASTKTGTGDYEFVTGKSYSRAAYGLAQAAGASALSAAVVSRTNTGFGIDLEADGTVYGLDMGFRRGRDFV